MLKMREVKDMLMGLTLPVLVIASVCDIKSRTIPLWTVFGCGALALLSVAIPLSDGEAVLLSAMGGMLPGLILILISALIPGSIGRGDGLLALSLGPLFGAERMAVGLMLSFILSGAGSAVMLLSKRADRHTALPFVPFLMLGMGVMMFNA